MKINSETMFNTSRQMLVASAVTGKIARWGNSILATVCLVTLIGTAASGIVGVAIEVMEATKKF